MSKTILQSSSLVQRFRSRELLNAGISNLKPSATPKSISNPFIPHLNTTTQRWIPPRYSLRRQADLVKAAKRQGCVHLLPHGPKNPVNPTTVVNKHATVSPILEMLQAAKPVQHTSVADGSAAASSSSTPLVTDPQIKWVGEMKDRTSFGLYGKRKAMFKGHLWEKQAKLRKEAMEKVVDQVEMQKRNMRWGRIKKSRKPRLKYPI